VKRLTNGLGAHATIVTAGSDAAYEQASKMVRNNGTLVCVGLPRSGAPVPISPFMLVVRGELDYPCSPSLVRSLIDHCRFNGGGLIGRDGL
jgi:threonine dehydrogenase-like Zn-dependent dehydrogenase